MIKLTFKYLLPLAFILVTGIIGYNYFYGTPEERESSRQIIAKVKGLGSDVLNLLKTEKEKFDAGKYDAAVDKIGASLNYLKSKTSSLAGAGQQYLQQLQQLESEKQELVQQLANLKAANQSPAPAEAQSNIVGARSTSNNSVVAIEEIQKRINELARKTEQIGMQIGESQ